MEVDALVENFVSITNAPIDEAKHYLEAYNNELDRAVDAYLEGSQAQPHHIPQPQRYHVPKGLKGLRHPPHRVEPFPVSDYEDLEYEEPAPDAERMEEGEDGQSEESFHTPRNISVSPTDMDPTLLQPREMGRVHPDLMNEMPEGFGTSDLHEQHMLESALLGIPFRGNMDRVAGFVERPAPRPPSPSTLAAREIREQQDFEYEESQRRDRERREAQAEDERRQREAAVIEAQRKQQETDSINRILHQKTASLPPEPSESDPDSIVILIRLPDGARCSRRFLKSGSVSAIFDFVDVETNKTNQGNGEGAIANGDSNGWWKLGGYNLVTPYPRSVVTEERDKSLQEAGLTDRQETLFVEMK